MAGQKGGYRQPSNPAPVSGPGALSQRTDGGAIDGMQPQAPKYMPGLGYGEGGKNMANEQAAPLAGAPIQPRLPSIPLMAPTQRPDEPVTAGIDLGPGPGSEVMAPMRNVQRSPSQIMRRIAQFDPSGETELIYRRLADSGN